MKSISDLVGNYRLLSYALNAYGLGDQINAKGLITKVLEGGVSNPKSLANTLPDSRWKAFAAAFNFVDSGATPPSSTSAVATTTSDYVEQQLESDQGDQDVGVQLALYFQRVAPTVTQRIWDFGRSQSSESGGDDHGALAGGRKPICSRRRSPSSCRSPTCRTRQSSTQLTERFTAMYDYTYGPELRRDLRPHGRFGQFDLGSNRAQPPFSPA